MSGEADRRPSRHRPLTVHLIIPDQPSTDPGQETLVTFDYQLEISPQDTVAALKTRLQSEDLLPSQMEDYRTHVALDRVSPCLDDSDVIPAHVEALYVLVEKVTTNEPSAVGPVRPVASLEAPPPPLEAPSYESPLNENHTLSSIAAFVNRPEESDFFRDLFSSSNVQRHIAHVDSTLRQLAHHHPDLTQLLNDPSLIKDSMEALRSRSLMYEAMEQTDRALRYMDAVPGGLNALRGIVKTLEQPRTLRVAVKNQFERNNYDLQTETGPNVDILPSPWVTPQHARPVSTLSQLASQASSSSSSPQRHSVVTDILPQPHFCSEPSPSSLPPLDQTAEPSLFIRPAVESSFPESETSPPSEIPESCQPPLPLHSSVSRPETSTSSSRNNLRQYSSSYQNMFPSQQSLRSLGGRKLPLAAHIRGKIHNDGQTGLPLDPEASGSSQSSPKDSDSKLPPTDSAATDNDDGQSHR